MRAQTDAELARAANAGDERAAALLVDRYQGFLSMLCRRFFAHAADGDDIRQEAQIALYKAWRDWDADGGLSFRNFVKLVVERHLIAYIIAARRLKHEQLTSAVRAGANEEGETVDVVDLVAAPGADAVDLLDERDRLRLLVSVIKTCLSPLERESLVGLVFLDESYEEIEARIFAFDGGRPGRAAHTPVKVVDNALMRARAKIRRELEHFGYGEPRPLGAAA